ncbi:MMPL family transporter [Nocardia sp. NPDC003345]
MNNRLDRLVTNRPILVTAIAVGVLLLSGAWGLGVFDRLNLAGYTDPGSESAEVDRWIENSIGRQTPDVVVIYTAPAGQSVDDIATSVVERLDSIDDSVLAKPPESYWTSNAQLRLALASSDRTKGLAVLTLAGDESQRLRAYTELVPRLQIPGIGSEFSGWNATTMATNEESKNDLLLAEAVAVPLTFLLLVVVFGSLVAAAVPVAVGGLAVFGSLGLLRVLSEFTDVSAFAVNIASILGLGLSIDYSLFVISRFREELREGRTTVEAARRTIRTAGRTVGFSALLLICGFAGMTVYPLAMLQALGFGAAAAIGLAALLSVTAVPAVLVLLGPRIDALSWRRGAVERGQQRAHTFWTGIADAVIRRPAVTAVGVLAVLAVFSLPAAGLQLGGFQVTGLPEDNPARVAQQTVTADFPFANNGATLLVRQDDGARPDPGVVGALTSAAGDVPGVRMVVQQARTDDAVVLHAVFDADDFSTAASDAVTELRAIPRPPGVDMLVGGENAVSTDSNTAIVRGFPAMAAVMVVATFVLMLIAFRSIVLPLKAIAMAACSLLATFGVLTWLFQDETRAGLLGITAGPLPAGALIMVVALVFGLSTDYEVFLMSRMVEAHDRGADTAEAIRTGMATTSRTITAAAALLLIVTGAASLSGVNLMKIAGVGMAFAILIDATLVRMLLVPALVKMMGRANWWSPWPAHRSRTDVELDPGTPGDTTGLAKISVGSANAASWKEDR